MSHLWEKIYTERLFECTFIYTSQGQTVMLEDKVHGGESRDFKTTTMADTIKKLSIQVRLSLIIPLMLVRLNICMGF